MKATALCLLVLCSFSVQAQHSNNTPPPGVQHQVAFFYVQPLGEFSETHRVGFGFSYAHSANRFGRMDSLPASRFGFVYGGALGWINGRKEPFSSVPSYQYGDFLYIGLSGGLHYKAGRNFDLALQVGPALSRYGSTTRLNGFADLDANFYTAGKLGISGGLHLLKENDAAWLAMAKLGIQYSF